MAQYLSTELGNTANQTAAPVGYKPTSPSYGGRLKSKRASFTLASQTTSDTLKFCELAPGCSFAYGIISSDTSLGSSTLSIGPSTDAAKYRAAAAFTATDTPTLFGKTAASVAVPLTATESIIGTIAAANLPASGNLMVEIFYREP